MRPTPRPATATTCATSASPPTATTPAPTSTATRASPSTPDGAARTVAPHEAGYQNNAAVVGGGTLVYGGQAWRFLPKDFRMASSYGVPAGSSLTDWPIAYDELAPWYERAEWEIGVAGDSPAIGAIWPRARDYPMPPVPRGPAGAALPARRRSPRRRRP